MSSTGPGEILDTLVQAAKYLSGEAAHEAAKQAAAEAARQAAEAVIENKETLTATVTEMIKDAVTPEVVKEAVKTTKDAVKQVVQQPSTPAQTLQSLLNDLAANSNELKLLNDLAANSNELKEEGTKALATLTEGSDSSSWTDYLWSGLGSVGTAVGATTLAWKARGTRNMEKRVKALLTNKPLFDLIKSSSEMVKIIDGMKDKDFALQALNELDAEQTKILAESNKLLDRLKELAKASDAPAFQAKLLAYKVIKMPEVKADAGLGTDTGLGTDADTDADTDSDAVIDGVTSPVIVQTGAVVEPVQLTVDPAQEAPVTEAEIGTLIGLLLLPKDLSEKVKALLENKGYCPTLGVQRAVFNIITENTDILQQLTSYSVERIQGASDPMFKANVMEKFVLQNEAYRAAIEAPKPSNNIRFRV